MKGKNISVIDLIEEGLKRHGYDGLYVMDGCACLVGDIAPCGDDFNSECNPGVFVDITCSTCEETGERCDYHIGPRGKSSTFEMKRKKNIFERFKELGEITEREGVQFDKEDVKDWEVDARLLHEEERAIQESAVQDIIRELTSHTGSTTALLTNILRYWSSEKMRAFAEALLSRCPQDDWKADTWLGAHDIAETELPRILSGWCKQPGLAAVIANYAIKVAQRHKACSEAVNATPPLCKCADYTAAMRGQESEAGDE